MTADTNEPLPAATQAGALPTELLDDVHTTMEEIVRELDAAWGLLSLGQPANAHLEGTSAWILTNEAAGAEPSPENVTGRLRHFDAASVFGDYGKLVAGDDSGPDLG